ncbi:MAG: 30S ribosome-binding factor RbfA [Chloroflexota bacterium]|nr:30S ribosome-binding factor RbfA [Chloroflexota bacterium]
MSRRADRINGLLRQELSRLILKGIKDPRLSGVVSITNVSVSPDLRNAKVYLSVLGNRDIKTEALAGIQSAASFLRRELRSSISLRYVPFLKFELDQSLEESTQLLNLLDSLTLDTQDRHHEQLPTPIDHHTK